VSGTGSRDGDREAEAKSVLSRFMRSDRSELDANGGWVWNGMGLDGGRGNNGKVLRDGGSMAAAFEMG
jgi:hypothetical protein